jgi:hypothetical protein
MPRSANSQTHSLSLTGPRPVEMVKACGVVGHSKPCACPYQEAACEARFVDCLGLGHVDEIPTPVEYCLGICSAKPGFIPQLAIPAGCPLRFLSTSVEGPVTRVITFKGQDQLLLDCVSSLAGKHVLPKSWPRLTLVLNMSADICMHSGLTGQGTRRPPASV